MQQSNLISIAVMITIRLTPGLFTSTLVWKRSILIIMVAEKISSFEMTNFQVLYPQSQYFPKPICPNISKIKILIPMQLCRKVSIQRDLSNNNRFSTEEIINNIPRNKKRKKSSESLSSFMFPILSWKLNIIAYRGRFPIPTSSKSELFCQYT